MEDDVMPELSEELKAQIEKACEEVQREIEASTDGKDICEILISLGNDATLLDFGPDNRYCGWYGKDGLPICWPDRRTVKVMEHMKYILAERKTINRRPALIYNLTEKAKHFLASRQNQVPSAGENFYTVLDKGAHSKEVYIYVGLTAPNPQEVIGNVDEDEGHKTELRGPHDWEYVYADAYGLTPEEVKKLEAQPI
jgi:hypothetical protein